MSRELVMYPFWKLVDFNSCTICYISLRKLQIRKDVYTCTCTCTCVCTKTHTLNICAEHPTNPCCRKLTNLFCAGKVTVFRHPQLLFMYASATVPAVDGVCSTVWSIVVRRLCVCVVKASAGRKAGPHQHVLLIMRRFLSGPGGSVLWSRQRERDW